MTSIALDLRHYLAEPEIPRDPAGLRLVLTHGQERVVITLSETSLAALWLAATLAIGGPAEGGAPGQTWAPAEGRGESLARGAGSRPAGAAAPGQTPAPTDRPASWDGARA